MSNNVHASVIAELVIDVDHMTKNVLKSLDCEWGAISFPFPDEENPLLVHCG